MFCFRMALVLISLMPLLNAFALRARPTTVKCATCSILTSRTRSLVLSASPLNGNNNNMYELQAGFSKPESESSLFLHYLQPSVTNILIVSNVLAFFACSQYPILQDKLMKINNQVSRGEYYR